MKAQKVVEAAKEYQTILETRGIVAERVSEASRYQKEKTVR